MRDISPSFVSGTVPTGAVEGENGRPRCCSSRCFCDNCTNWMCWKSYLSDFFKTCQEWILMISKTDEAE